VESLQLQDAILPKNEKKQFESKTNVLSLQCKVKLWNSVEVRLRQTVDAET